MAATEKRRLAPGWWIAIIVPVIGAVATWALHPTVFSGTHDFSGVVMDDKGRRLGGAIVEIAQDASVAEQAYTGDNGGFTAQIKDETKSVHLTVQKEGYENFAQDEPGRPSRPVEVRLVKRRNDDSPEGPKTVGHPLSPAEATRPSENPTVSRSQHSEGPQPSDSAPDPRPGQGREEAERVQVRFCWNARVSDDRASLDLWVRNVQTGIQSEIGVLNNGQPGPLMASLAAGLYQFGGHLAGSQTAVRSPLPINVGVGASYSVGVIVYGLAPAQVTVNFGCGG